MSEPGVEDGVEVRHWAAARELAGLATERVTASTVGGVLAVLSARHGTGYAALVKRSLLLVDGESFPPGDRASVPVGVVLEVLPPYAGG